MADFEANKLRTAKDEPVPAEVALRTLQDGNRRFLEGRATRRAATAAKEDWVDMVQAGQSPFAAVLGCADSRCPVEILFDAKPGDIFVCRNAGNTCTQAEGSMVGSLEFCVGALRTNLVLVMGHTKCGALKGATKAWQQKSTAGPKSALDALLQGLISVADAAASELGPGASEDDVANHAVHVNVMKTVEFLLQYSKPIREAVRAGKVQVQGAVYHIESGMVEFMGSHPNQEQLLQSQEPMPQVLAQRAAAPTARTYVAQAAVAPVPMTSYAAYTAPAVAVPAPVQYATQSIAHAAPVYTMPVQTQAYPAVYAAHGMPTYTSSASTVAQHFPTGSVQYIPAGASAPMYRQA